MEFQKLVLAAIQTFGLENVLRQFQNLSELQFKSTASKLKNFQKLSLP